MPTLTQSLELLKIIVLACQVSTAPGDFWYNYDEQTKCRKELRRCLGNVTSNQEIYDQLEVCLTKQRRGDK